MFLRFYLLGIVPGLFFNASAFISKNTTITKMRIYVFISFISTFHSTTRENAKKIQQSSV